MGPLPFLTVRGTDASAKFEMIDESQMPTC